MTASGNLTKPSASDWVGPGDAWASAIDHFNRTLFDGQLRPAAVSYRTRHGAGCFHPFFLRPENGSALVELALNPNLLAVVSDERRLSLLVRLLVFQEQWQQGTLGRANWENRDYRLRMERLGLPVSHDLRTDAMRGQFNIDPGGRFLPSARLWLRCDAASAWRLLFAGEPSSTITLKPSHRARALSGEARSRDRDRPQTLAPSGAPLRAQYAKKLAYRCPRCTLQVWGKPALRIRCANCDCALVVHEPTARSRLGMG